MWRTCHRPPIAQGGRDREDPRARERERERERYACEVATSGEEEYAKENAHTAQCATSMDIRKRKQPFLYIFLTFLPTFLLIYLPTYQLIYLSIII
jgi:hypothetical protein